MKLLLANPRGFCAGVIRAIHTVEKALELYGAPIYVKHEIVHNTHVVERLKQAGAIFVEDLREVPAGQRVIYSAHGVSPQVKKEAKERGLLEIDATCGLVTKVHSAAKRFAQKGYQILLIGHKNHVEIIGTKGEAPDVTHVIETVEDVEKLFFPPQTKLFYLTQTTLSVDDVEQIVRALTKKFPKIETLPTSSICYATTNRQLSLKAIAEKADLVLIIGDEKSSNSNRLREIGQNMGKPSYLVNSKEAIDPKWFMQAQTIALSAGASTPEEVVHSCIEYLMQLGVTESEEILHIEENVYFELPKSLLAVH